ncbi:MULTISPECIES: hypothetical protein [Pectobacterium]|uniref:hypothetical protein n=1 Tax=Pectobacterium TaxID=122277 RepID=UPI00196960EE|nr:hypothetical protein [Pectobacterium brasiliense]MBN3229406.1 hypothetical protein [Pectobacterium brasiliense]
MQIKLTIDGKLVDPKSPLLSERLSADELKHLVAETSNTIERKKLAEKKHLNDVIRKVKMEHGV